jgi:hypothetical protein
LKTTKITFTQLQKIPSEFDLDYNLKSEAGKEIYSGKVHLKNALTIIEVSTEEEPFVLKLDLETKLLFEEITLQMLLERKQQL